jgi:hypothetical protein
MHLGDERGMSKAAVLAAALTVLLIAPASAATYVDPATGEVCEAGTPICYGPEPTATQRAEEYERAQWILHHLTPEQRRENAIGAAIQDRHDAIDDFNSRAGTARHCDQSGNCR